ncbi:ParB N-terminal domain-containing protein [Roseomonas eburnea]|uniref:ParB N-terminal domain-containing protein n=1 Tax=Neoroseomonas eburnea TaxID=1346889 RepID=A0A9X9XH71_9PROT|nr:plasmid partitioning protein RepB C-terminal domain-containing protein [Neoroseomonas eburnea]MBR0683057.1 ParB N-terminal domain-containing protein [Neoroseomonas eburnea]
MSEHDRPEPREPYRPEASEIRRVPVDRIRVINPRVRNQKIFASIVDSIATIGLKRPITVALNGSDAGGPRYDLVCGQGRLEAFLALGEKEIPSIVVQASEADRYLMSLVENLARRKHSNADLLSAVRALDERGYTAMQICRKTGLDQTYIRGVLQLLAAGEERLIAAVEKGWLPITLAMQISAAGPEDVQVAMMEAYDSGMLRGEQLMKVRRLIDRRQAAGKRYTRTRREQGTMTPRRLLLAYQAEVRRQRLVVKKAEVGEQRLLFVVSALRRLMSDEHLRTLLRAENVGEVPKPLADRLSGAARP